MASSTLHHCLSAAPLTALLLWPLACGLPPVAADDAGDESFVRQVVPVLQGRKIRGYAETKLLSDLVKATDRPTVLKALMAQNDFIDHWTEVLVDDLEVHRDGARAQNLCYGDPLLPGAPTPALANAVLSSAPGTDFGTPFNMSDLVRSSLKAENAFPAYAGHLYAMANRPGFAPELTSRTTLGNTFGQVYLHREMLCLTCHNSEYSLSGESSGWDRTHPIRGYFEEALYGSSSGMPLDDAFAIFRTDVRASYGGGSNPIAPWGISGCGSFDQNMPNDPHDYTAQFADLSPSKTLSINDLQASLAAGYAGLDSDGLQRFLPPEVQATCDFCSQNCEGTTVDVQEVANAATNATTVKAFLTTHDWDPGPGVSTCISCHGGTAGLNLSAGNDWADELIGKNSTQVPSVKLVEPGDAANSYLIDKLRGLGMAVGTQTMPYNQPVMSNADILQVEAWIDSMPALTACGECATTDCGSPNNYVEGHEAFAFLTAANIVNNVWTEAMGAPLTIGNYFPRNTTQNQALRNLTEYHFIPQNWSIQAVLVQALASGFFNRTPVASSNLSTPYVVPPLLDPWIEADPRVPPVSDPDYNPDNTPENHVNAMGEGLYRYSARSLLNSVARALGWPTPPRFPTNAYPSEELQRAIGQYFTDASPGFRATDLQGILFWENVHGACEKPNGVAADWIDKLITAVNSVPPDDPAGPVTVEEVAIVVRDWLLGNGTLSSSAAVGMADTEVSALADYFGVPDLSSPVSDVGDLDSALRGYCGVLIETPQFWLGGLASQELGPEPRLRVCNQGPCTYRQMCLSLAPAINNQLSNHILYCGNSSVSVIPVIEPPDFEWVAWCVGPGCGLLIDFVPADCYQTIAGGQNARCNIETPMCDVRFARAGNCGGPMPTLPARGTRPLVLAWADGVEVELAEGVMVQSRDGNGFRALRSGATLRHGDLLKAPVGSHLHFSGAWSEVKTPENGMPRDIPSGALFISVVGEEAVRYQIPTERTAPPIEHIRRVQNGWARHGEAGPPLTIEQFQSYEYPKSELQPRK